eukprot:CAMPEP_0201515218 /NCGR_PEP_ID=MMETSP0161_2-20130828/6852_1 /ASSEMBLY_ACC=CAM_ASM_000251 /TAXON_ID=180227 /ORGANISM="Neoparamoeba aestuarina, Strain SoJaBio B1-5/56/2" /LENGTH=127 /DNA_ID=CAMNT_0047911991 /DNA_START=146 /DNA_END=529 /DNA_ORIENTATION=+
MAFHTEDLPLVDGRTTNNIEDGPSSLRFQTCSVHPIEAHQRKMNQDSTNLAEKMLTGIYGSHMVMRVKMEDALLSQTEIKPGLPKRTFHKDIMMDQDESLDFSDMLQVFGEAESKDPLQKDFDKLAF